MDRNETIPFVKMEGAGNDFVVLDNRDGLFTLDELIELTPSLCNRKYGVGGDGLLALQQPTVEGTDYEMVYRNADGSDAGMCGNGSRCLALFARELGMGSELSFSVHDTTYRARVKSREHISVSFPAKPQIREIDIEGDRLLQVHTGTEHVVEEIAEKELENEKHLVSRGRKLRNHRKFSPLGTNANFFCGINKSTLKLQTYERGVEDLTLACGTGAIAAALGWHHLQDTDTVDNSYEVQTRGGQLRVAFTFNRDTGHYGDIRLIGPAHMVFEGNYYV